MYIPCFPYIANLLQREIVTTVDYIRVSPLYKKILLVQFPMTKELAFQMFSVKRAGMEGAGTLFPRHNIILKT